MVNHVMVFKGGVFCWTFLFGFFFVCLGFLKYIYILTLFKYTAEKNPGWCDQRLQAMLDAKDDLGLKMDGQRS